MKRMKIDKSLAAAAFVMFAAVCALSAQTKPQTIFNLEEAVEKEVAVPDAVIAVLKSDRIVDGCFRKNEARATNEAEWFAASKIDLNGDGRMDLIVKAKNACLYAANQGPFWIFQNEPDGFQKILSSSGLRLAVLTKKSNSFNRIKISRVVAMKRSSEIFDFRAGKYRSVKSDE